MGILNIERNRDFLDATCIMCAELDRLFLTPDLAYLEKDDEEFVFEGLFPFLLNILPKFGTDIDSNVLRTIGVHLSSFTSRALDRTYSSAHLSSVSQVLVALSTLIPGAITESVKERSAVRLQAHHAGISEPPVIRDYKAKYGAEDDLNGLLNRFTERVQWAYGGANTVEAQLPSAGPSAAVAKLVYCDPPGGNETMPLSPEFQAFVDLFVKYDFRGGRRFARSLMEQDVSSLIRALETSHRLYATFTAEDQARQLRLDRRILQILRAVLHNEIRLQTEKEGKEGNLQRRLARLGSVLPVASMISSSDEMKVQEALSLLGMLLKDGNKAVQRVFMHFFLNTREESFFEDVRGRLLVSIRSYNEVRELRAQALEVKKKAASAMGTLTLAGQLGSTIREELAEDVITDVASPSAQSGIRIAWSDGGEAMELTSLARARDGSGAPKSALKSAADSDSKKFPHVQQDTDEAGAGGTIAQNELDISVEGNIELLLRLLENLCEGKQPGSRGGRGGYMRNAAHRRPNLTRSFLLHDKFN